MSEKEEESSHSTSEEEDHQQEAHVPLRQTSTVRPHETETDQLQHEGQVPPPLTVRPTELPLIRFGNSRNTTNGDNKAAKPRKLGVFEEITTSSEETESVGEAVGSIHREIPLAADKKGVDSTLPAPAAIADPRRCSASVDAEGTKDHTMDYSKEIREIASMMAANIREQASPSGPPLDQPVILTGVKETKDSRSAIGSSDTASHTATGWSQQSQPHATETVEIEEQEEELTHRGDANHDGSMQKGDNNTNNNNNNNNVAVNRKEEHTEYYDGCLKMFEFFMIHVDNIWKRAAQTDKDILAMLIITVLAFLLTILSSPLSQLDVIDGRCYTYWGYKDDCDSVIYANRTSLTLCSPIQIRLNLGAAFSSMALILLFAALGCIIALVRNTSLHLLRTVILGLFCAIFCFQLIAWASIANIYISRYCENTNTPRTTVYGVGFGMLLTSWFLIIIDLAASALFLLF